MAPKSFLYPCVTPAHYDVLRVNPEFVKLVRPHTREERKALHESLLVHGQREPIVVDSEGTIVAGHNRAELLMSMGRPIKTIIGDFEDDNAKAQYVIESNLIGRHYSNTFLRIVAALPLYRIIKSKQHFGGDRKTVKKVGCTTAIVGRHIGVNRNLVQQAIWLYENAPPDVIKSLQDGGTKITAAYNLLRHAKIGTIHHVSHVSRKSKDTTKKFKNDTKRYRLLHTLLSGYTLRDDLMKVTGTTNKNTLQALLFCIRQRGIKVYCTPAYTVSRSWGICCKCGVSCMGIDTTQGTICEKCIL